MNFDFPFYKLSFALILITIVIIISKIQKLGIEKSVLVGTARSFVQLFILGYILDTIFNLDKWYFVLLMLLIMILFATYDVTKRQSKRNKKLYPIIFLSLVIGLLVPTIISLFLIIEISPWYKPHYLIPLSGMVIGNSMNALSIAIERFVSEWRSKREEVELYLSFGASPDESTSEIKRFSMRAAMIPTINMLMVSGIVHIPGMMTGQILAGASPISAVKYQLLILYMILTSAIISTHITLKILPKLFFENNFFIDTKNPMC